MPEAFAGRLRPLLPDVLPLRAELGGCSGGGGEEQIPAPAEGTAFLVPLLLHVTNPAGAASGSEQHEGERQLWLAALGEPGVLQPLVQYAHQCAAACAPAVATAADTAADDALLSACQLLLNVLSKQEGAGGEARQQVLAAPDVQPLLRRLASLAALRQAALQQPDASPNQVVHAARCA